MKEKDSCASYVKQTHFTFHPLKLGLMLGLDLC